ncbi:DegV family protein [Chloroflexota bacterium]
MGKVAVITDSVACLPQELIDRYAIKVMPLSIIFEDRVYRDGVDITPGEFYRLLENVKKLPTTSPAPPAAYLEAYRELNDKADAVLCVTISSKFSALIDSARLAREAARETMPQTDIEVLDSGTAAGAEGFVVLAAARAAAEGKSLAEVIEAAKDIMSRVNLIAIVDTLYYLQKSGRVPKATAWATSLLQIKPIFQLSWGEVTPLGRPRTKNRAVNRMLEIVQERTNGGRIRANIMHGNALEEAERLRERVLAEFDCVELFVTDFTPVMGSHVGPGVLGVAFYSDN